jgi:hypothetical protein
MVDRGRLWWYADRRSTRERLNMPDTDWTPQEQLALIAPIFGLSLEQASDAIIIMTDKDGQYYQSYMTRGTHVSLRERLCRLIYFSSIMNVAAQMVNDQLHEEVHKDE